jgi:hypothetical protein
MASRTRKPKASPKRKLVKTAAPRKRSKPAPPPKKKAAAKPPAKRKPVKNASERGKGRAQPPRAKPSPRSGASSKKPTKEVLLLASGKRSRAGKAASNGVRRAPPLPKRKTKKEREAFKRRSEAARKGWTKRRWEGAEGDILRATRTSPELGIGERHGKRKDDWYVLRNMIDTQDDRWKKFLELAENLGLTAGQARNEWMSPKAKGR